MAERKLVITLHERDVQHVVRAVIDNNKEAALDFLKRVIKPQVDARLNKGQCKPFFEWQSRSGPDYIRPPDLPGK